MINLTSVCKEMNSIVCFLTGKVRRVGDGNRQITREGGLEVV